MVSFSLYKVALSALAYWRLVEMASFSLCKVALSALASWRLAEVVAFYIVHPKSNLIEDVR